MRTIKAALLRRPWSKRTYYLLLAGSWVYAIAWLISLGLVWTRLGGPIWAKLTIVFVLAAAMPDGFIFESYPQYLREYEEQLRKN